METPSHLPSRPRDFVDLLSDDEEGEDVGLEPPSPHPGHFPEIGDLDDLILGNLVRDNQAVWDAVEFEAQRIPAPIVDDWLNGVPQPVPEGFVPPAAAPDLPQMFRQAERLNLDPLPMNPVNPVNKQADNEMLDNYNDLMQQEVNNQLNNDLLDDNDLLLAVLNNQNDDQFDENNLILEELNNQNNDLLNNNNLILEQLHNQLRNNQMDNNDNFVWTQVNVDRHNANKNIDRDPPPTEEMINKARCLEGVADIFPDICLEYIGQLYTALQGRKTVPALVELVLQGEENGEPYPKLNQLKRKRPVESSDEEEEIMRKYTANPGHNSDKYLTLARGMLAEDFPSTPMSFVMKHFYDSGMVIYTAYQSIAEAERLWDPNSPSYNKLKQARKVKNYHPQTVEEKLADPEVPPDQKRAYSELKDVRIGRAKWEAKLAAKRQREADEAAAKKKYEDDEAVNLELAIKEGTMEDCGCCYDEFPRNRMVHCNNESIWHYFCTRCARLHAETQVGSAKYKLQCMSTDVCEAGYSVTQRQLFLDSNLTTALDRIEAETALRLAGIENLASCPFCSYAAEYPPIEHERLFHCERESCAKTSCRLCQKESHIPKTCKENAKDIGLDVRREVEEAMTAALVRLCNKCKGPFIKEDGCNKMNCPCGNIQCYVCSKSCQYNHFDDERRGGKAGNCPLFDDVNKRHEDETKRAEELMVEKLRKEHPEVAAEDLEIRVSDAVKADEEKRRAKRHHPHEHHRFILDGGFARQELPAPPPLHVRPGNQERQMFRDAFVANMPPQHLEVGNRAKQVQKPGQGQQPPNLQGAAAPASPPANRYRLYNRHRHRDPARQALFEAAHARILADRQERFDAAIAAADAGRKELRDRLAAGRKEAREGLEELVRERMERMAADEAAGVARAADMPRRGEDGDAEVIYRPGDAVVPRRRVEDWVFEPFGPPPDGVAGERAGNAGNAGNAGGMSQEDALAAAYAVADNANRAPPRYNREDFRLRDHRAPPRYNREDFRIRDHRKPFPLPQHPPRPPAPHQRPAAEMMDKFFMEALEEDYVEQNGPEEDPMAFLDDDYIPPLGPIRGRQASGEGRGRRLARALGREILGRDGRADKQGGDKQEGDKDEREGRREGERGLDFLMRLRRGKSKSKKAKGEEKK